MLYYTPLFLVVGMIAGVLHLAGGAAVAVQISWILFLVGIVLVAVHVITGRSARMHDWWQQGCPTVSRRDDLKIM